MFIDEPNTRWNPKEKGCRNLLEEFVQCENEEKFDKEGIKEKQDKKRKARKWGPMERMDRPTRHP